MNELIGAVLETARSHFLENHSDFYKFATSANNRSTLEYWLDSKEDPIDYSVRYAAAKHTIDSDEILNQVGESLRFRVLAGILTRPIDYLGSDELSLKLCGCQEYDSETGGWPCKVPSNQEQADAWHSRHGNSPACPFWENPQKRNPLERNMTELDKMLLLEGEDLESAWRQLGLKHKN